MKKKMVALGPWWEPIQSGKGNFLRSTIHGEEVNKFQVQHYRKRGRDL